MRDFIEKLGLKVLNFAGEKEMTGCYVGDILSYALANLMSGDIWITSQKNANVSAIAYRKNASCVILANSVFPDDEMISGAKKAGVNVFSTSLCTYDITIKVSTVLKFNGGKQ